MGISFGRNVGEKAQRPTVARQPSVFDAAVAKNVLAATYYYKNAAVRRNDVASELTHPSSVPITRPEFGIEQSQRGDRYVCN